MRRTGIQPRFALLGPAAVAAATALMAMAAAGAHAQAGPAVQYYFSSSDTAYVPISSEAVAAGQTFTLSIFYTTSGFAASGNSFNVMDVFVGFDRSNSYGTSATPIDNRLTLGDGNDPNLAVTTDPASSGFDELFPGVNEFAGGQPTGQDGTLVRPYGDDIALSLAPGADSLQDVTTATHLLDITFTNENLAAGPETISVYNGGSGTDATTYVDGTALVRPNSTFFTVSQMSSAATPEPGALTLLLSSAFLPLGRLIRKRSH